jgi:hypothetical protein
LLPYDVSAGSSLVFGIDPATIRIGSDGVIRYVVVARSREGAINAMYEGIRCSTGEFKTYARQGNDGTWSFGKDVEWKPMRSNMNSRHTFRFAQQGGCVENAPPKTVADVVRSLKNQDHERRQ